MELYIQLHILSLSAVQEVEFVGDDVRVESLPSHVCLLEFESP